MARNGNRDYFGLNWLVSVILCIIPVTSAILGIVTRFKEGHWICALFRLIFGWNIIWILDIFCMIFSHHIFKLF